MKLTSGAIVAIVAIGVAGFIGLYVLIPADEPEARSALLGVLVTSVGAVIAGVVGRISRQVNNVQQQVNGRAENLIRQLPADQQQQARADFVGGPVVDPPPPGQHRQT